MKRPKQEKPAVNFLNFKWMSKSEARKFGTKTENVLFQKMYPFKNEKFKETLIRSL